MENTIKDLVSMVRRIKASDEGTLNLKVDILSKLALLASYEGRKKSDADIMQIIEQLESKEAYLHGGVLVSELFENEYLT